MFCMKFLSDRKRHRQSKYVWPSMLIISAHVTSNFIFYVTFYRCFNYILIRKILIASLVIFLSLLTCQICMKKLPENCIVEKVIRIKFYLLIYW